MSASAGLGLELPHNLIPMSNWKSCICFIRFRLVFDRCSEFELLYVIYTCWFQPSLLIFISKALGWRFQEIYNMKIISCEPFLY